MQAKTEVHRKEAEEQLSSMYPGHLTELHIDDETRSTAFGRTSCAVKEAVLDD